MSIYSGKCDVYDSEIMIGEHTDSDIKNVKFYAYDNSIIPLRIDSIKDLMPYFAYIEVMSASSDGYKVVHLSKESFVDSEDREILSCRMDTIKRYYRKCKRNKIPFTIEDAVAKCLWSDDDLSKAIAIRVFDDGEKATIDGLHTQMWYRNKKMLYEEMVEAGYGEFAAARWNFGLDYALNMLKHEEIKVE